MSKYTRQHSVQNFLSELWGFIDNAFVNDSDGRARGRRGMMCYGIILSVGSTMSGGLYLTGLMLACGADDNFIGIITTMTSLCSVIQFFSPLLWEHFISRKRILIGMQIAYHVIDTIFIGITPLLPVSVSIKLILLFFFVFIKNALNNLTSAAVSAWHMQSLPMERRTDYYMINSICSSLVGNICAYLIALSADAINNNCITLGSLTPEITAFMVLRIGSVFFTIFGMLFLVRIPEYPYGDFKNVKRNTGLKLLLVPFGNNDFILAISIQLLFSLIDGIIGLYFTVYCMDTIHLSYSFLSLASIIGMPLTIILSPLWASLINKRHWNSCLCVAYLLHAAAIFCNALTTENTQYMYIVVIILYSVSSPCRNIIDPNLQYVNMPEESRTAYISFFSVGRSLAVFLGNVLGNIIFSFTDGVTLHLFGLDMCNAQYVCILQTILYIFMVPYIILISKKIMIKKFR